MKRMCCVILSLLLLLTGLCACDVGEQDGMSLWFLTEGESGSLSLVREDYNGQAAVPDMMAALLNGPRGMGGLISPIPDEVELLGWKLMGKTAVIDLSHPYDELTGLGLTLADYCITLTLTQLEGVDSVSITVDGFPLRHREKQSFRKEDVVLSGAEEEPVELTAALCFRQAGGNELGVELRMFRLTESESATLAVLQALLAGPKEAGLTAILPPELTVYSARVDGGICYADFSVSLLELIPETLEAQELVVRSIVESLCSLGHVQAVQLLVEGEPLVQYGEMDVSELLTPGG